MSKKRLSKKFLQLLKNVTAKRPRTIIEHILRYGQITTEEIKELYGYNHPPRAIRDVREHGIPIKTFRVTDSNGRRIAAYAFGSLSEVRATQLSGRTAFSAKLKAALITEYGARCNIYLERFPERDLQIDHRIPFEIIGDDNDLLEDPAEYMLLCAPANRAKSWSCESCANWKTKDVQTCQTCYWAYPEKYSHIAMRDIRRLDILWVGKEMTEYDRLKSEADKAEERLPEYVKKVLRSHFLKKNKG